MKKVVRSIAVVALMFVAATGLAKEPKLSLTPNAEKSLNFEMDISTDKTLVSIVDIDDTVIYSEIVVGEDIYSKKFNLNNLPKGSYFLKVEDVLKETVFSFIIEDSKIIIAEKTESVKPTFRKTEKRIFINLLNLEKEAIVVKVFDSENRVVFEEAISDEILIEKVFNFEEALKDDYTVMVKNKKGTYYEVVSVR